MHSRSKAHVMIIRMAITIVAGLCAGQPSSSQAQEIQVGVDFSTIIPRGDFKQNINNNGYGVGGQLAVGLGRTPLFIGVDAGFVNYGSEKRREPFSSTIPDVEVDVNTNNNIILTHLLLRVQPRSGPVRPYVDGLVGFKYLFTETSINDDSSDEPIASTTNFSDFTFSYGLGGGVQVLLARTGRTDITLDGKVRYLRGSRAEYLKKGSIRRDGGVLEFDLLSSRTDVLGVQIGVTFRF